MKITEAKIAIETIEPVSEIPRTYVVFSMYEETDTEYIFYEKNDSEEEVEVLRVEKSNIEKVKFDI